MTVQKDYFRIYVCLILIALLLPCPALGSWGLEVGRADPGDVANLAADWNAFKRSRNRINDALLQLAPIERQRQLLGLNADDRSELAQLAEEVQQYWLMEVVAPLQRVAMNPAASCAEVQFALSTVMGMERQRQLIGLGENQTVSNMLRATGEMASLRCREEALDECVATGRFVQIPALMTAAERQSQLLGRAGDLESWAEDALKQCAIYELHFVSKTTVGSAPMGVETVRDGRVAIKLETPAGGLVEALRRPLSEILKGQTVGGNDPFFVSIKCTSLVPIIEVVCSPGANSTPIKVGINLLDLKHREFYVESELSKERAVGEDKFSFDFSGGIFSLQGLLKAPYNTTSLPMTDWGNAFYMAHQKDAVDGLQSRKVRVLRIQRGVYPVIFQFTYADQSIFGGATTTDSTEFELIHKPKPKPFPERSPEPIRRPLRPRSGE
ncbi:MAG: hypothetical protein AAB308_01680 [Nitrospirota bacterium]